MQASPHQHSGAYDLSRQPRDYPCPRTIAEFHALLQRDEEALRAAGRLPGATECTTNCNVPIQSIHYMLNIRCQPSVIRQHLQHRRHHALRLSDEVMNSLNLGMAHLTDDQLDAIAKWKRLLRDTSPTALLQRLGEYDVGQSVSNEEMMGLIEMFVSIFLNITAADNMRVRFFWSALRVHLYGHCTYSDGDGTCTIEIDTIRVREIYPTTASRGLNGRALSRLGTLLHELIHAYLQQYSCHTCASHNEHVKRLEGHGRAWQRIAAIVERATVEYLGVPLSMRRFNPVRLYWNGLRQWPTLAEVREWGLVDE